MTNAEKELQDLRAEISKLDTSIVQLLDSRAEIAKKIGDIKQALGRPIIDREHEQKVYERVSSETLDHLAKPQIQAIFREIIAGCRAVQSAKKPPAPRLGPPACVSGERPPQVSWSAVRTAWCPSTACPGRCPN